MTQKLDDLIYSDVVSVVMAARDGVDLQDVEMEAFWMANRMECPVAFSHGGRMYVVRPNDVEGA